jgi:DNA-binding MarR family transcriptional regulator
LKHFTDGLNLLGKVAFDILLFLANNPEYKTASDIVEYRGIKANLVSVNVDKLVHDRYLKWRKNRIRFYRERNNIW